ncbi:MAG TPA: hypothetical protein VH008_05455 [Pseudonocardia sp.]|nr:hypothetical protein [Pseudonocardia sp.]
MTTTRIWSVRIAVTLRGSIGAEQQRTIQSRLRRDHDLTVTDSHLDDCTFRATLSISNNNLRPLNAVLDAFEATVADTGTEIAAWDALEIWLSSPAQLA